MAWSGSSLPATDRSRGTAVPPTESPRARAGDFRSSPDAAPGGEPRSGMGTDCAEAVSPMLPAKRLVRRRRHEANRPRDHWTGLRWRLRPLRRRSVLCGTASKSRRHSTGYPRWPCPTSHPPVEFGHVRPFRPRCPSRQGRRLARRTRSGGTQTSRGRGARSSWRRGSPRPRPRRKWCRLLRPAAQRRAAGAAYG